MAQNHLTDTDVYSALDTDPSALHDEVHPVDRWVAASAVSEGLPLLSGDGIYRGAPGHSLLMAG